MFHSKRYLIKSRSRQKQNLDYVLVYIYMVTYEAHKYGQICHGTIYEQRESPLDTGKKIEDLKEIICKETTNDYGEKHNFQSVAILFLNLIGTKRMTRSDWNEEMKKGFTKVVS